MDPRLLTYYNRELQHIREMGGEFAREFPKIAGRLGLDGFECADPYVERLLEGFGFLAGRIQLKIDAEFSRFTRHLLEMVYPHYLAPTPSMGVVRFEPDLSEGGLVEGFPVPRGSALRSQLGKGDQTACEYRTAHDVTLWPLELTEAEYFRYSRDESTRDLPEFEGAKAGLRLRLRTTAGTTFDKLKLNALPVFLRGADELPMRVFEQLLANACGVIVRPVSGAKPWQEVIERSNITACGFDDAEALLPFGPRSFHGYRLLQEYFAFPERFMFVEFGGLGPALRRGKENELDLIVFLDRNDPELENVVDASNFALFCSPVINLFPKRADRIHLDTQHDEFHVVPDRTRPMDYEVSAVTAVTGHGTSAEQKREFLPFYAVNDLTGREEPMAYFTVERRPRVLSSKQRRRGPRSSYAGNEVFLSIVDAREAPYAPDLKQLSVMTLCTNRDLPLHMSLGHGRTDFTMESGAPVNAVRCVAGPTKPIPSHAEGETAWRLVSHLSLNYLSLLDSDERQGAAALRELLGLYGNRAQAHILKQIEGVRSVTAAPITRRVSTPGPIAFARGLEVTITFDESLFEGTGVFLLGAVLERFVSKYVSINSFTRTVVATTDRGEVMQWPVRTGLRHTL